MPATTESRKCKLSLLQLAEELGNVSKAFWIMGYHRDTFYEVRRTNELQSTGVRGARLRPRSRVSPSAVASA